MSKSWDTSELDGLIVDFAAAGPKAEGLTRLVIKKVAFDTVAGAQARVPVDTSNLKNSIGPDLDDDGMGFEAGPTANYGAAIEFGSEPHVIKAKNAKALFWPGAEHPVKQVNHPGNAPQPYMRPAFEQAVEPIDKVMGQVGEKAIT
ncbi:MAG: HK97 gp10 family phage protein [Gemmatimonadaceae bacterium]